MLGCEDRSYLVIYLERNDSGFCQWEEMGLDQEAWEDNLQSRVWGYEHRTHLKDHWDEGC